MKNLQNKCSIFYIVFFIKHQKSIERQRKNDSPTLKIISTVCAMTRTAINVTKIAYAKHLKNIMSTRRALDIDIVLASYEIQRLYDHCDRKSSCSLLRDLEPKPLGYEMYFQLKN